MHLETDLKRIGKITREQESENLTFSTYLKKCLSGRVDALVKKVYREVSSRIDCRRCANCCRKVRPVFTLEDLARFSSGLSLSVQGFRKRYFTGVNGRSIFKAPPCPFLSLRRCTNYALRPKTCRDYPNLEKGDICYRLDAVIAHLPICPITFNVFQRLKGMGSALGEGAAIPYDPDFAPFILR